jgi:tetratricopeptide (TPR) repeat protein
MLPPEQRRQQLNERLTQAYELKDSLEKRILLSQDPIERARLREELKDREKDIVRWEAELEGRILVGGQGQPEGQARPTSNIGQYLALLAQAEADEDWDSAIDYGEQLLALNKNHQQGRMRTANAYYQHGLNYHADRDYEMALADFARAIALKTSKEEYYYARAKSYKALKKENEYRLDLERAAELGHEEAKKEVAVALETEALVRIVASLNADNKAEQKAAAKQYLSERLQKLQGIDQNYITWAEYQLFIDQREAKDWSESVGYYQPDHWRKFTFPKGQAHLVALGVRAYDAKAFCDWLTEKGDGKTSYRLPTPEEARQFPAKGAGQYGAWCQDNQGGYSLIGLEAGRSKII